MSGDLVNVNALLPIEFRVLYNVHKRGGYKGTFAEWVRDSLEYFYFHRVGLDILVVKRKKMAQ